MKIKLALDWTPNTNHIGFFIAKELGFYNSITKELKLDVPGIVESLKSGAQPTKTVKNLLIKANIIS